MKRKKKGSLELSVNSIVILIIAIAVLGLIIGFIYSKFKTLTIPAPDEEPVAPSEGQEITTSPSSLEFPGGKSVQVKVAVFSTKEVTGNITLKCGTTPEARVQSNMMDIPAYSYKSTVIVLKTPKVPKETYLCKWNFSNAAGTISVARDVALTIN